MSAGARARRQGGAYLFLLPALAYLAVTMLYPVYSNVRMSLHDVNVTTFLGGACAIRRSVRAA